MDVLGKSNLSFRILTVYIYALIVGSAYTLFTSISLHSHAVNSFQETFYIVKLIGSLLLLAGAVSTAILLHKKNPRFKKVCLITNGIVFAFVWSSGIMEMYGVSSKQLEGDFQVTFWKIFFALLPAVWCFIYFYFLKIRKKHEEAILTKTETPAQVNEKKNILPILCLLMLLLIFLQHLGSLTDFSNLYFQVQDFMDKQVGRYLHKFLLIYTLVTVPLIFAVSGTGIILYFCKSIYLRIVALTTFIFMVANAFFSKAMLIILIMDGSINLPLSTQLVPLFFTICLLGPPIYLLWNSKKDIFYRKTNIPQ